MNCNTTRSHPLYFYSRPCGRGDLKKDVAKYLHDPISTHAPAGGATPAQPTEAPDVNISTHAPAGGATHR